MAEKVLERKPLWCLTITVEKLIKNLFLAIRKLPILYKMTAFLKLLKSGLSSSWSFHEIGDASVRISFRYRKYHMGEDELWKGHLNISVKKAFIASQDRLSAFSL
jgi:hypothetical protein